MSEHDKQKDEPTKLSAAVNRGCLTVFIALLVVTLIGVGGLVYVFLVAEPSDVPVSRAKFEGCTSEEVAHLTEVHAALMVDGKLHGDFNSSRLTAEEKIRIKTRLMRPWPMKLICVESAECTQGVVQPGSIILGTANVKMCGFTTPDSEFCESYATVAYGNARAHRMLGGDAARYRDFAKGICEDRN